MRYQSCGCAGVHVVDNECRGMICQQRDGAWFTYKSVPSRRICDGYFHCRDESDEVSCDYDSSEGIRCDPSRDTHNGFVPPLYLCDSYMDCKYGEDELDCGFDFGIECVINKTGKEGWVDRKHICDGEVYCKGGEDEDGILCQERNQTKLQCTERGTDRLVAIREIDTCYYPRSYSTSTGNTEVLGCKGLIDQTNCSSANVFKCTVDGKINTRIRDRWLCNNNEVCDNGQDEDCISFNEDCRIHKHMICDGIKENGCNGEDEKGCDDMFAEGVSCERLLTRNETKILNVPMQWLCDGTQDCVDGIDENSSIFKCRQGIECPDLPSVHVRKDEFCDGFESCAGSESQLCKATRLSPETFNGGTMINSSDNTVFKIMPKVTNLVKRYEFQFPCLPGIMKQNTSKMSSMCTKFVLDEIKPSGIYSVNRFWWKDCDMSTWVSKVRGLRELFCTTESNSQKLTNTANTNCTNDVMIKKLESVHGNQLKKFIIFEDETLTDRVFTCQNGKCIQSSLLCNFVDDCGDGSDEVGCPYFHKCYSGFPKTVSSKKVCDNVFDCSDGSDECIPQCGNNQLLRIAGLRYAAMIIGIASFLMNTYTVFQGSHMFLRCRSKTLRINHFFMVLIGIGDWSMGLYLIILASTDAYYGDEYCQVRYEWLTSKSCSFLGVLSTFASTLSVFTMVVVSVYRASKVAGSPFSEKVEVYGSIGAGISCMILAGVISAIPLSQAYRDYFSNGLWYRESNVFPTVADMNSHMQFISKYKQIKHEESHVKRSWEEIENYITNLFINDGPPEGKHQTFYGNDPVCLFKYFVKDSDPQYAFSLMMTVLCFACFIVIFFCYAYVGLKMKKEGASQGMVQNKDRESSQKRIQIKIMAITLTDLATWFPFCILAWIYAEGVDIPKEDIYQVAAVFLLPINSIMNPIIYNEFPTKFKHAIEALTTVSHVQTTVSNKSGASQEGMSSAKKDNSVCKPGMSNAEC